MRCGGCASGQPEEALRDLASQVGDWVKYLPDLSILVIEQNDGEIALFTLARDKAHYNVAFLFDEKARRKPEEDVLTILPGLIGSYPNFYFHVRQDQLESFIPALKSIQSQSDYMAVVEEFGVRRTSPDFWALSDRIYDLFLEKEPTQAGILDLNRYKDPKPTDDPD